MSANKTGEDFFLSLPVTYGYFGNNTANGLVTEQLQYSIRFCFFSAWQNIAILLISNGLRFIFTCMFMLALLITFHLARHTFATTTTLAKGVPIETVSKMLGHTNIETTQIYARITNNKISNDMQGLDKKFIGIEKIYKEVSMK